MGTEKKKVTGLPEELVFLVVDDDNQVRQILTEYLESFGFKKILTAKDGKDALKVTQNHAQRIDFIISDWEMPNLDGLGLLHAVRRDSARDGVKFLMVSSQDSQERKKISEAAKAQVDAYVVKPFRAHVLKDKINNLIVLGIDKDAQELDELLDEVPSNEMQALAKDMRELGHVVVEPEKDLPDLGSVKVDDTAAVDLGSVEEAPHSSGHENVTPPENYDLKSMSAEEIVTLAKLYQSHQMYDKAIRLCTDGHFLFPGKGDILYQLAYTNFLKEDFFEALRQLKRTTKVEPYHVEAQTLLAEIKGRKKAA